ncbi:MAG: DUF3786 domain-containing protein [Desulfobacterales bacterium]
MARVDDYRNARHLAAMHLKTLSFSELLGHSGFSTVDADTLRVPFLDREYWLRAPEFSFRDCQDKGRAVPLQEQVLILHYLEGCSGTEVSGRWVAYREIPGAGFYFGAFVKRTIDPLKKVFGHQPQTLIRVGQKLGGQVVADGDVGLDFRVLPQVPLKLILWQGDEEFPPEANILFDASAGSILSPEDLAWLAGMLVYRLIARSR